jgi:ABC-type uncharacterized transport system permease subunit
MSVNRLLARRCELTVLFVLGLVCGVFAVLILAGVSGIQGWETTRTVGLIVVLVNTALSGLAYWFFTLGVFEVVQLDGADKKLKFWHVGTWSRPLSEPKCHLKVSLFRLFNEERPWEPALLSVWAERPFLAVVPVSRLAAG